MPWEEVNVMDQRTRFVVLAKELKISFADLCKEFCISRKTGYKWVNRVIERGITTGIQNESRRPHHIARRVDSNTEARFVALRTLHPTWGAGKLIELYTRQNNERKPPSERTVNRIIERNGLKQESSPSGVAFKRFEHASPNDLWQMDYKGEFRFGAKGQKCYPFDVLDDHSRFSLCLDAHNSISWTSVKSSLTRTFYEYGLPLQILMDHGSSWYATQSHYLPWTQLTVWIMQLGICIIYCRIRHPQTQGKIERFHRTFKYDLIKRVEFDSFSQIQPRFDAFRLEYNTVRPHGALNMQCPVERYEPSLRKFTGLVPSIEYPDGAIIRKLNPCGVLAYKNRQWFVSEALANQYVMLEEKEPEVNVFFVNTLVRIINLKEQITY